MKFSLPTGVLKEGEFQIVDSIDIKGVSYTTFESFYRVGLPDGKIMLESSALITIQWLMGIECSRME